MDMVKLILIIIIVVHAVFHLYGFANEWFLAEAKEIAWRKIIRFSPKTAKMLGIVWLIACMILILSAGGVWLGAEWWRITALIGVVISQLLIVLYIKYAWFGTVVNILIIAGVILLR